MILGDNDDNSDLIEIESESDKDDNGALLKVKVEVTIVTKMTIVIY